MGIIDSYMRRLSGRPEDLKSDAKLFTDAKELRSSSMVSSLADGICFRIASLTSLPADVFLTAITTWTPRSARTRAVSVPRPLEAPEIAPWKNHNENGVQLVLSSNTWKVKLKQSSVSTLIEHLEGKIRTFSIKVEDEASYLPVTMAVRPDPSIPWVTSSAVENLENPDGPFNPNIVLWMK